MKRFSQQLAGKVNAPELQKAIIARGEQMANIRRTGDVNTEYIPALNLKRMYRDVMGSKHEPESLLQLIRRHPEYRRATGLIQKYQNDIARMNHISGKLEKIPDREYKVLNDDINKAWNSDDKGFWHRLLMRLRGQIPTEKYQAKDNARKKAVDFWVKHVSPDRSDMPQSLFYDLPSARLTVQRHKWDPNSSDMKMYQENIKYWQKHKAKFVSSMRSNRLADTLKNQEQKLLDSLRQSGTDVAYLKANPKAMQHINVPDHIGTLVPTGVEKRVGDMHYLPTSIAYRGYHPVAGNKLQFDARRELGFHADGSVHTTSSEFMSPNANVGAGYASAPSDSGQRIPGWMLAFNTKQLQPHVGRIPAISSTGKTHQVIPWTGHLTRKSFDPDTVIPAAKLVQENFGQSFMKKLPQSKIDDIISDGLQNGIPSLHVRPGFQQGAPYENVITNLDGMIPHRIYRNTGRSDGDNITSISPLLQSRHPDTMYKYFVPSTILQEYRFKQNPSIVDALTRLNQIRSAHGSAPISSFPRNLESPKSFVDYIE